MTLKDFINQKLSELEQCGKYKEVTFKSADAVMLREKSVSERFNSSYTPSSQKGREVTATDFPKIPTMPFVENGSKVVFEVIEKRKRKPITVAFYFLWEESQ